MLTSWTWSSGHRQVISLWWRHKILGCSHWSWRNVTSLEGQVHRPCAWSQRQHPPIPISWSWCEGIVILVYRRNNVPTFSAWFPMVSCWVYATMTLTWPCQFSSPSSIYSRWPQATYTKFFHICCVAHAWAAGHAGRHYSRSQPTTIVYYKNSQLHPESGPWGCLS